MRYDREQVVGATWLNELVREAQQDSGYFVEATKIDIAFEISRLMKEGDISKAELARRLGKSRAYVTKILNGATNFTIESLVKIGFELGYEIEVGTMFVPIGENACADQEESHEDKELWQDKAFRTRSAKQKSREPRMQAFQLIPGGKSASNPDPDTPDGDTPDGNRPDGDTPNACQVWLKAA